ncbi:hypothetical protein [Propionispira raffinosivorans]|uniref:hypothetical protein n=1 Tax=Propionispira raffinosivorans TaxID=86959 RepID=UPI000379FE3E|nr:hypothetical protein [Propionispira raffinosivorans]
MDKFKSSLIIIFKEQNPYRILENYFDGCKQKYNSSYRNVNEKVFVDLYQRLERQCSIDEAKNIFQMVQEDMRKCCQYEKLNSVFYLLLNYAEALLENHLNKVYCKYKALLRWRAMTLKLDQDMFVTAFLAFNDMLMGIQRSDFNWGSSIKSNNIRLHTMLKQGMAENHFHLKGSAPAFQLNWVSLMNNIHNRKLNPIDKNEKRLGKDLDGQLDITNLMAVAAVIRAILFLVIQTGESSKAEAEKKSLLGLLKMITNQPDENGSRKKMIEVYTPEIQESIDSLKCIFETEFVHKSVDYAIVSSLHRGDLATSFFVGERALLYRCFQCIYRDDVNMQGNEDLFYAYLIIKNKIRAEIIQQNGRVGFANFSQYQDRKGSYIPAGSVLKKMVEPSAILTTIKEQRIVSLEARIMPGNTRVENVAGIRDLDKRICEKISADDDNYWKKTDFKKRNSKKVNSKIAAILDDEQEQQSYMNKYFYVLHFPKKKDPYEEKLAKLSDCDNLDLFLVSYCRHQAYRKVLKKQAVALYQLRENNQGIAQRIVGIDACSNELDTRPEVYGQAFRCLKGHLPYEDYQKMWNNETTLENLRLTYHVGEDFLDVVDGLRAIDEARLFLGMTHGDRLGHAVALGIDVRNWYEEKCYKVYLSQQDILDNVAWMIMQLKKLDFDGAFNVIDRLTTIYNDYYLQIYITEKNSYNIVFAKDHITYLTKSMLVPVDDYMKAWELRGNNPECYRNGNIGKHMEISYWDRCAIRRNDKVKYDPVSCELYERYHYDPAVKKEGFKKTVFKIEPYMIAAIEAIQKNLQKEICACGIGIECNPSSNHLISNFKRYDKHPILNMYNLGLTVDPQKIEDCPQLFVSINTDDQGVFDTLLENEYALMGIALEKVKDENGKPLYKQAMVYDWLDRIRKMGIEQSFRSPNFEELDFK